MRNYVKVLRAALTVLLMLAAIAEVAVAGPLEDALYAWFHRDYATAMRLWRELAEQGDAKAQIKLGLMYELGQGVPQDNAEALKWSGGRGLSAPSGAVDSPAAFQITCGQSRRKWQNSRPNSG